MNEMEYETEEKKKFQITRGMVLLIVIVLIVLVISAIIISNIINSRKPEYTISDFTKLESRMLEEAPTYLSQKNIELTSEEIKIDLKDLLLENGGSIDSNKVKATKICEGYVLASKIEIESYKAYIKCSDLYTSNGYISDNKVTTTKKTTTKKDTTKPVITIIGEEQITINVGTNYEDAGAIASDNKDGDITSKIKVSGSVDTSVAGIYIITYSVSDKAGNKAEAKRQVTVVSVATTTTITTTKSSNTGTKTTTTKRSTTQRITTPPTITLKGSSKMTINLGDLWVDPGYSAVDAMGMDITGSVNISGKVNPLIAGTYSVIYSVTDAYGNSSSKLRVVTVTSSYVPLQSITLTPNSFDLKEGESKTLTVNFSPSNASNKKITWKSSNTSVVSVSSAGVVKAIKKGTATITVSGADGATASAKVVVK